MGLTGQSLQLAHHFCFDYPAYYVFIFFFYMHICSLRSDPLRSVRGGSLICNLDLNLWYFNSIYKAWYYKDLYLLKQNS